jgi:tetratricopeptide (TPR) repeat protein
MNRSVFLLMGLISVLALTTCPAFGQVQYEGRTTGNITGQVRYAQGGQPAFNVLVSCDSFSGGLIGQENTDRNGRFQFRNVALAQYVIIVRVPGYVEERETVELQGSPDQYLQIRLRPDGSGTSNAAAPPILDANVPADARKEFEKADAALASNKKEGTEEGIRHLEKAISIYPRFVQAQLKLGTAYMDLGQWDQAEKILLNALATEPKTANALFALGETYLSQKKDSEAEKVLLQGLQIEDRSFQAHLTLGRVYWDMALKTKDEAQARPLLDKSYEQAKRALELNPGLAGGHLLKGNLLLRVRRAPDALHEFEEYLRLDPKGQLADQTRAVVEKIKKALAQQKAPEQQKKS